MIPWERKGWKERYGKKGISRDRDKDKVKEGGIGMR